MEKTIKEWLETLPEPIRTEALENAGELFSYPKFHSLVDAIYGAFEWDLTKQGWKYWENVRIRAEAGEFNNSSLDKDSEKL